MAPAAPVLSPWHESAECPATAAAIEGLGTDVAATITWAVRVGRDAPLPGSGETARLWELLADAARADVAAARILEPHLDALAILDQARGDGVDVDRELDEIGADRDASWGVFAAEGPGMRLEASPHGADGWRLNGTKPWCSLAASLSHAVVTAWVTPDARGLFAVPLSATGVSARPGPWVSRGLSQVVSAPVDFDGVRAVPIGEPGWYLSRAGFAWGGIGVAAAWWGGALPLHEALIAAAARDGADQLSWFAAGSTDAALWGARAVLAEAAEAVDSGRGAEEAGTLAARARAVVADAVERVLALSDRALGPGPLTADEDHARRVADLRIYVRQHHGERDLARLGGRLLP
ncbi:acyl-CoA dehydrogenase [Microbacterium sp. NPDC056044]|uniref:acyl-CoA dehydrogenase n=1 Tax=Microbacterium sp. NPDC056044 TaxID=3345690 RepID=UPI0035D90735